MALIPDEVVLEILGCVESAETLFSAKCACKQFHRLAGLPRLWQRFCSWRFWNTEHGPDANWKQVYEHRRRIDIRVGRLLNTVIHRATARLPLLREIASYKRDALDHLLHQSTVDNDVDVLARNYHASCCIQYIQRQLAVEIWKRCAADGPGLLLETAIGALSLFRGGFVEDISEELDRLAQTASPRVSQTASVQEAALAVCSYMHEIGFGGADGAHYYDLDNSFLDSVVRSRSKTIPLTLVVVFCCPMRRLGFAHVNPINFPAHILVRIDVSDGRIVFVDLFREGAVRMLSQAQLMDKLALLGFEPHLEFLVPARISEIVCRAARNILNSLQRRPPEPRIQFQALYAALSALVIVDGSNEDRLCEALASVLCSSFAFRLDVDFLSEELVSRVSSRETRSELEDAVQELIWNDERGVTPKTREPGAGDVQFRVGTVMNHARFEYTGIIVGWTTECEASERWQAQMRTSELRLGKSQPFYNVIDENGHARYVAQENIVETLPQHIGQLGEISELGRYFKRFQEGRFILSADLEDEYPDDQIL